jgi:alpha-1,6-mannosyltransferase
MAPGPIDRRALRSAIVLAALIELPLVIVHFLPDLQHHSVEAVTLLLTTSIFYILSVWLILKDSQPFPLRVILPAAALFRITLLPLPPAFTDDLYRYRWEGKLQAAGGNPYRAAPADPTWQHLRDETYPKVDGKQVRAVYGPLTELTERATYRIISNITPDPPRQVFWFKIPAAIADLGIIAALLMLVAAQKMPLRRILIYAWCPLPVFVFWGTGHNDAFVVLFIALALAAAARDRRSMAYLWLSLAAAAKLWPVILFPAFTGWRSRQAVIALAILSAVAVITSLPFGQAIVSNRDFTSGFLGGWRNNDSLFGLILNAVHDPYRAKHITFALVAASALAFSLTRWTLERKVLATVSALLLFSSNVHPWYATWLLPPLVVECVPAALLFISLVPVFYESVPAWITLHEWNGVSWLRWPVYGGVLVAWLAGILTRRPRRDGHTRLSQHFRRS